MLLAQAERKGVEVSEPKYRLQEANTVLISARNLTHDLSSDSLKKTLGEGEATLTEVEKSKARRRSMKPSFEERASSSPRFLLPCSASPCF